MNGNDPSSEALGPAMRFVVMAVVRTYLDGEGAGPDATWKKLGADQSPDLFWPTARTLQAY